MCVGDVGVYVEFVGWWEMMSGVVEKEGLVVLEVFCDLYGYVLM